MDGGGGEGFGGEVEIVRGLRMMRLSEVVVGFGGEVWRVVSRSYGRSVDVVQSLPDTPCKADFWR